jgi:hypothetical protein
VIEALLQQVLGLAALGVRQVVQHVVEDPDALADAGQQDVAALARSQNFSAVDGDEQPSRRRGE